MFRDFLCVSCFENTYGFARTSQGEMGKYSIVTLQCMTMSLAEPEKVVRVNSFIINNQEN